MMRSIAVVSRQWDRTKLVPITGPVQRQWSTRGTATGAGGTNPASVDSMHYRRSGGASHQEWSLIFPRPFEQVTVHSADNGTVRTSTWGAVINPGETVTYPSNQIWIAGNPGVVDIRFTAEERVTA